MISNLFRRCGQLAGVVAVAVSGVTAAMPATAVAADKPGSTLVVLGDSFTANGFRWDASDEECLHGPASWPTQLSSRLGVAGSPDFVDVSCSGAAIETDMGYSLVQEAVDADELGAFGPRTKLITLQFGLNDTWGDHPTTLWKSLVGCVFNLVDGCDLDAGEQGRITDYRGVSGEIFAERVRGVVEYLKYYAPQAKIVLVGYPELIAPGEDSACVSVFGVGDFVQPRGAALVEFLDRIDQAQRAAAQRLGVEFFDTRAVTAGHDMCSAEPWVNGLLDPRADLFGIPFHPSAHGDSVVADALYEQYGR